MAPDEVIKDYGADMLRLWVASADYTQDMRISKDIMKQLSQAYLKIRNTARYMLGNLCDFDADTDAVPVAELLELDRFALSSLNDLVKTVRAAYDRYEFHGVYRAIYNFFVVDMSNFYLDIIKDRLYCGSEAQRRSAQTALYYILDGMTRLVAPILAFTSDEIWHAMKHDKSANAESVLLNDMPEVREELKLSDESTFRWGLLVSVRDAVNKALENTCCRRLQEGPGHRDHPLRGRAEGRRLPQQRGPGFPVHRLQGHCHHRRHRGREGGGLPHPLHHRCQALRGSQVPPLLEPQRAHRHRRPSHRAVPPLRRCGGRITSVHRPSLRVSVYERLAA